MTAPPVSVIPAVRAYLQRAIQAQIATDPTPSSIAIDDGDPDQSLPDNQIIIGEVRQQASPETFIGSGGLHWMDEDFDIDVVVYAWSGNPTTNAVTIRAWQIAGYVSTAVRLDPSLGTLVLLAFPARAVSPGPQWSENPVGPGVVITVTVHVQTLN